MKNKLLILTIVISLFIPFNNDFPVMAKQTQMHQPFLLPEDVSVKQFEVATVVGLGFLNIDKDKKFRPDNIFTNGDAVECIVKLYGLSNGDYSKIKDYYPDIDEDSYYAPYIMSVIRNKFVFPNGVKLFEPDKPADYNWFVKMLMDRLGYENIALEKGGNSYAYNLILNEANISVNIKEKSKINRIEAAEIIFETLSADKVKVASVSNNGFNIERSNETLLSDYDFYVDSGVVSENAYTQLNIPVSTIRKNQVRIADKGIYYINNISAIKYLGYNTKYLYYYDESSEFPEICYIMPDKKKCSYDTLNLEDINYNSVKNTITYYDDSNDLVSWEISETFNSIYNNVAGGDVENLPKDGFITLIDSDNDGKYETIQINAYSTDKVIGKSIASKKIYTKSENNIELDDMDSDIYIFVGNNIVEDISDISNSSLLNVFTSVNEKIKCIYVTSETVSGTITGVEGNTITVNETQYNLADYDETKSIAPGNTIYGYITIDGKLAEIDINYYGDFKYGYLIKIAQETKFIDSLIEIKLLTSESGVNVFKVAPKFSINDDKKSKYDLAYLKSKLLQNNNIDQLIRYRLNSNREIDRVDIAKNNTIENGGNEIDNTAFSLDYDKGTKWMGSMNNERHYARFDTVAFMVPKSDNIGDEDDDKFIGGNYAAVIGVNLDDSTNGYYKLQMYDTDENYGVNAIVLKDQNAGIKKVDSYRRLAVINKKLKAINKDGIEVTMLEVYINGEKKKISLYNKSRNIITKSLLTDCVLTTEDISDVNITMDDLAFGDTIYYALNSDDIVTDIVVVAKTSVINRKNGFLTHDFEIVENSDSTKGDAYLYRTFNATRANILSLGKVVRKMNDYILYNVGDISTTDIARSKTIKLSGVCYLVDTNKSTIEIISPNDVLSNDIVITRSHVKDMWDVVIYR